MDKTSKKVLDILAHSPEKRLLYFHVDYESSGLTKDEFFRCVRYLADTGMVEYISNQDGLHIGVQLTHKAVHAKEFQREEKKLSFKKWLLYSYLGGVITGVTTTIFSQFLINNGSGLLTKLLELLHAQ